MKRILLTLTVFAMLTGVASAAVLWDQSDYNSEWSGLINSQSGCVNAFSGVTYYTASDITVYDEVTFNSITVYFEGTEPQPGTAVEAILWIAPRTGALPVYPGDDPVAQGITVPVTATNLGDAWAVTASGLNITMAPGDYWVALTPAFPVGDFGPATALNTNTFVGIDSASIEECGWNNPPFWGNYNPGFDTAILIEGTIDVVSTEGETWGGLKAIYR